jgi:hypothetical protein
MWEEVVEIKFKAPSRKLLDRLRKLYGKPAFRIAVLPERFEPGTARIRGRIVTVQPSHSIAEI